MNAIPQYAGTFDRFDICEAYAVLEWDWHLGGWLHERPSNVRRGRARGYAGEATSVQLARLHFRPYPDLCYQTLSENGRAIYDAAVRRWHLTATDLPPTTTTPTTPTTTEEH